MSFRTVNLRFNNIADKIAVSQNLEHKQYLEPAFRELDEQTTDFGDSIRELRSSGITIAKAIVSEVCPPTYSAHFQVQIGEGRTGTSSEKSWN